MGWLLALLLGVTVLMLLGVGVTLVQNLERENRFAESQLRMERMYDETLEARVEEMRRFRHDVNGLLQAVEFSQGVHAGADAGADEDAGMGEHVGADTGADAGIGERVGADAGAGEDADMGERVGADTGAGEDTSTAMSAATGETQRASAAGDAENAGVDREGSGMAQDAYPLVDAIIRLKRSQCAQSHVAFSCDVATSFGKRARLAGIAEADACAVVQNLLDNAYEASLRVEPESERMVSARLSAQESLLVVEVTNRIAEAAVPTFQTTKPNPEQHGIGLRVVGDIVQKYGGELQRDFDSDARLLTMRVMLGGKTRP